VQIELHELRKLGAKSGDRVEVQVLSCAEGWDFADEFHAMKDLDSLRQRDNGAHILMTNRASFTVP
jgi:hypothetical protein